MSLRFYATYYDGKTSTAYPVEAQLAAGNVLVLTGEGVSERFSPDDIRISSRLGNTLRSIAFRDGQKCETQQNDLVDELQKRLGRGGLQRLVHAFESRLRVVLGALFLLIVLAVVGVVWGIPFAAKQIAQRLPDEIAFQIGSGTLELLDESLFDPSEAQAEDQERLRGAFAKMAESYPQLPLHLEFRKMGIPNAFALPDGTVVVTDKLLDLADTDAEVLAVLAHEIGHVDQRHGLRMALESSSVALLLSVYVGDASQVTTVLATLPAIYAQAGYSRGHETEADVFALEFMKKSGQDPQDFADIMRKLQKEMGGADESSDAIDYLASHPPTKERIARFEAHAHPKKPAVGDDDVPPQAE